MTAAGQRGRAGGKEARLRSSSSISRPLGSAPESNGSPPEWHVSALAAYVWARVAWFSTVSTRPVPTQAHFRGGFVALVRGIPVPTKDNPRPLGRRTWVSK